MKNKLYFLLTTLILWGLCNSCENQEFDSLWDQKVETRSDNEDELIYVYFTLEGEGTVEVSSESLGIMNLIESTNLRVKEGEVITFKAISSNFDKWEHTDGTFKDPELQVIARVDYCVYAYFDVRLYLSIYGAGVVKINGQEARGPGNFEFTPSDSKFIIGLPESVDYEIITLVDQAGNLYLHGDEISADHCVYLRADFWENSCALQINEISNVDWGQYELILEGYEREFRDIFPFTYFGGMTQSETHSNFLRGRGITGRLVNRGNKSFYVRTTFSESTKKYLLYPEKEIELEFSSSDRMQNFLNLEIYVTYRNF